MRKVIAASLAVASLGVAAAVFSASEPPIEHVTAHPGEGPWQIAGRHCPHAQGTAYRAILARNPWYDVGMHLDPGATFHWSPTDCPPPDSSTSTTTTTTTAPSTTSPVTTSPPTTSTSTTPASSTTAPATTMPPSDVQWSEGFADESSLDRIGSWVYHRNVDESEFGGFSGGSWQGDHDHACGSPFTKRPLSWDRTTDQATRRANSLYWCPNTTGHFMTSMGDVDGYSIVAVWPDEVFDHVSEVCVDVSLVDLGTRQWLKIGVVTDDLFDSRPDDPDVPGFLVSDVDASNVAGPLAGPDRMIASWSGGASAGYPGYLKIGDTSTNVTSNPTPTDPTVRHEVCLVDNGNNTVTFTVAGVSVTRAGSFPDGDVRVVLYQHSYTPSKSETGSWGTTMHWDSLTVV